MHVLATGGTISGLGEDRLDVFNYSRTGERASIEDLLARLPEASRFARLRHEQFSQATSMDLTPSDWIAIAKRIDSILAEEQGPTGIVVTVGTAALEDLAFFLHLTVRSPRPVVLTGSMRPPSAVGTDADVNLMAALWTAGNAASTGVGVLAVMDTEIHSARDARIDKGYGSGALNSGAFGPLGYVEPGGEVLYYRTPTRTHTSDSEFGVAGLEDLPWTEILWSAADSERQIEGALRRRSAGIVVAASEGTLPSTARRSLIAAADAGVEVVVCTRFGSGRVPGTADLIEGGLIAGDDLLPNKARILLMLGLAAGHGRDELRRLFRSY